MGSNPGPGGFYGDGFARHVRSPNAPGVLLVLNTKIITMQCHGRSTEPYSGMVLNFLSMVLKIILGVGHTGNYQ